MENILLLLGLGISSVQDIKWKKIWLPILWGNTFLLLAAKFYKYENILPWLLCCIFSILFFLLVHRITKKQIGVADAFLFGMTGAGLGWRKNFLLINISFFLVFFVAVFLAVHKKAARNYEMPLSPFVLFSYLFVM